MTTAGPNSAGTVESVDRNSEGPWDNPDNAKVQNSVYAYRDITKKLFTDWLRLTNFGFSIDADQQIDGVVVEVDWYAETIDVDEDAIQLVLSGVQQGDDKSTGANVGTSDDDNYNASFGGAGDGWSAGLDYADINNANFGVQISVMNDHAGQARQCRIDHVRITVYHSTPAAGGYTEGIDRGINRGIL